MKLSRRNKKKHKNKHKQRWQTLSNAQIYVQEYTVGKEEINQIAFAVFGGVNVSSKDL